MDSKRRGDTARPRHRIARRLAAAGAAAGVALALAPAVYAQAVSTEPSYGWYTADPEASSYTLHSARDWNGFVNLVNGTADLDGDGNADAPVDFRGKTVDLPQNASFNFRGGAVQPAGGQDGAEFDGVLNGNGTSFDNYAMDAAGTQNVGLIGQAGKDSSISGIDVGSHATLAINEGADGSMVKNVGMVVGQTAGPVSDCSNNGTLTVESAVAQTEAENFPVQNVGGVVGIGTGDISDCTNNGALTVSETSTPRSENEQAVLAANIGGVVGSAGSVDSSQLTAPGKQPASTLEADIDNAHGTVQGCANNATVTVSTPSEAGLDRFGQTAYAQSTNVGGIAGYSRASVSGCTNSGYLDGMRSTGIGGIVGSLRGRTTSTSYSGQFSASGSDDGMAPNAKDADAITVSGCQNSGDIRGFVSSGGIVGRAGTYTAITGSINQTGTYIVALRWNKPFPAGIVGGTYGTVSYCANLGSVASATSFDETTKRYATSGGYYAAGIAGNTMYYSDTDAKRISPLPEVHSCYNAGSVLALDNMRQRALVGDNAGYVHDNLALEGCVSTNELVYGDNPADTSASGGTSKNNRFVSKDVLQADTAMDGGGTSITFLNAFCDANAWQTYWMKSDDSVNAGYPALNSQSTADVKDIAQATVSLAADASYTGLEAVPRVNVTLSDGTQLVQNQDFQVVPQQGAVEVTDGQRPYTASVKGIGAYAGTAEQSVSYGIGKGDLANCSVTVDTKTYNGAAQVPDAGGVHVLNAAGKEIDASEYTFALTASDKSLTDGQAVNARKYGVTVTASPTSEHFTGTNTDGVFNIKTAMIICPKESGAASTGNHAQPNGIEYLSEDYDWFSMTQHKDAKDSELTKFAYTGYPIKPTVTGVTLSGTTVNGKLALAEGADYRVVYGQNEINASGGIQVDNAGTAGKDDYGYIMVRYAPGSNFSNYEIMKFLISDKGESLDLVNAQVQGNGDVVYEPSAGAYTPITVWYGGSQLTEGVDYTVSYTNNDKPGTASYTVSAVEGSRFTGQISGTFNIVEKPAYDLEYAYSEDGTATVTGIDYHGTLDKFDLAIPATVQHDGKAYAVTAIGDKAFGSNNVSEVADSWKKIGSVTIPATVKSIGAYAFCSANITTGDHSALTSVKFEKGSQLQAIGDSAFRSTSISSIDIPEGVQTIGKRAFMNCANLSNVTFEGKQADVPQIAADAFQSVQGPGVTARMYGEATGVQAYAQKQKWTIKMLSGNEADKSALEEAIGAAQMVQQGKKTDDAFSALQQALSDARTVYADDAATQDAVDTAVENLDAAVDTFNASSDKPEPAADHPIAMYRLYNPYSGEHLYTDDQAEVDSLTPLGWRAEGIGWYAPENGIPVHRLYNPYVAGGDHHYTANEQEVADLVQVGWRDEGVLFYSASADDPQAVPVYREYNPNAYSCNHNYTADVSEHKGLVKVGWNDEGIGWYGVQPAE